MPPSYKPVTGKEKWVNCPFNPLHMMGESSLQRHIIRCMKNYPGWVSCPYNALHRFRDRSQLTEHMLICESKKDNVPFAEPDDSSIHLTKDVPYHLPNIRQFNLAEEDWDA